MAGISEALDLIKKAGQLAKAGLTIELQETIMDLRHAVLDVKDEMLSLRAELQALKSKEAEIMDWRATEARYPLVKAPGGAMVRHTAGPPEHYACPKCFEDQKLYPLQDKRVVSGEYSCPGCDRSFPVEVRKKLPSLYVSPPGGGGPDDWMAR